MFKDSLFRIALITSLVFHAGLFIKGFPLFQRQKVTTLPTVEVVYYAPPSQGIQVKPKRVASKPKPKPKAVYKTVKVSQAPVIKPLPAPPIPEPLKSAHLNIPIPADLPPQYVPIFVDYYKAIRARIMRYAAYPLIARKQNVEGDAYCQFNLSRDGELHRLSLSESSGSPILDQAALQSIRAASPYPHFPSNLPQQVLTFHIQITFEL
jgi:periplasmic protein TonB